MRARAAQNRPNRRIDVTSAAIATSPQPNRSTIYRLCSTTNPSVSSLRFTIARTSTSVVRQWATRAVVVAVIGPDQSQLVVYVNDLTKQHLAGEAVAGLRGGDHHDQLQAERVDHDMPLAAIDGFAAVATAAVRSDDGVRLDRLRVDHTGRGCRVAAQRFADLCAHRLLDRITPNCLTGRAACSITFRPAE